LFDDTIDKADTLDQLRNVLMGPQELIPHLSLLVPTLFSTNRAQSFFVDGIIDTPMGRLDSEHRNQLVERYFPHASHQVIILSTDTEIEANYFEQLQPSVARAYHLN
jgi:DNA sulfur modification protein DndD